MYIYLGFIATFRIKVKENSREIYINIVTVNLKVEFHLCQYFLKVYTKCVRCRGSIKEIGIIKESVSFTMEVLPKTNR